MRKAIKELKGNVVQVTTVDERWYAFDATDTTTGLAVKRYLPSVTWITGHYPKGIAFHKWLASKGWDEAEAIKVAAGDKGSKIHNAIGDLIDGKVVTMDAKYLNPTNEQLEELALQEYEALMGFVDWWSGTVVKGKPKYPRPVRTLGREILLMNEEHGYAGMGDWIGVLEHPDKTQHTWLIDWKSGQNVWPEYELQVSAYKHARPYWITGEGVDLVLAEQWNTLVAMDTLKLGILQVGYRLNERGWKLTEVTDQFDLFLATKKIWAKETEGQAPMQKDYPLSLTLPANP